MPANAVFMKLLFSWLTVGLYSLFTAIVSFIPINAPKQLQFSFSDKLVHIVLYAVLAFLVFKSAEKSNLKVPRLISFFYVFFLGVFIEAGQYFLPWRSFELADIAFNSAAWVVSVGFVSLLRHGKSAERSRKYPLGRGITNKGRREKKVLSIK